MKFESLANMIKQQEEKHTGAMNALEETYKKQIGQNDEAIK